MVKQPIPTTVGMNPILDLHNSSTTDRFLIGLTDSSAHRYLRRDTITLPLHPYRGKQPTPEAGVPTKGANGKLKCNSTIHGVENHSAGQRTNKSWLPGED